MVYINVSSEKPEGLFFERESVHSSTSTKSYGKKITTKSLILAQDERWRRA